MIHPGARPAWQDLAATLRPYVARRVRGPADVDDVLQDTFLRIQRGLGGLRDDERFGPWVYQVARSAIADHRRRSGRHAELIERCELDPAAPPSDENDVECELAMYMAPFIATLASPYREALTLTELEGRTQKEAASTLGISLSGMKSRVQRGRAQLRQALEQCCAIALDARGRVVSCERKPEWHSLADCCAGAVHIGQPCDAGASIKR